MLRLKVFSWRGNEAAVEEQFDQWLAGLTAKHSVTVFDLQVAGSGDYHSWTLVVAYTLTQAQHSSILDKGTVTFLGRRLG